MAIDLYVLIFTPLCAMVGFGSRVVWERYVKGQEEMKNTNLISISFKLNEFYYPIYMKLLKIDRIITILRDNSSDVEVHSIETIPYDFLWENYTDIQNIIDEKRSKANPGEDIDYFIEQFNEIVNYFHIWKVMNPVYYETLLREGETMDKINGNLYRDNKTSSRKVILDFHTKLDTRISYLKEEYKNTMEPNRLLDELRNCTCSKKKEMGHGHLQQKKKSDRGADLLNQPDNMDMVELMMGKMCQQQAAIVSPPPLVSR